MHQHVYTRCCALAMPFGCCCFESRHIARVACCSHYRSPRDASPALTSRAALAVNTHSSAVVPPRSQRTSFTQVLCPQSVFATLASAHLGVSTGGAASLAHFRQHHLVPQRSVPHTRHHALMHSAIPSIHSSAHFFRSPWTSIPVSAAAARGTAACKPMCTHPPLAHLHASAGRPPHSQEPYCAVLPAHRCCTNMHAHRTGTPAQPRRRAACSTPP